MVHIEGTNVCNPWLVDAAHCLDSENRAVWHGNVSRLLGTMYHAVGKDHHLASILGEIGIRKPGKKSGLAPISPFEFPSEVARYMTFWHSFVPQFTWSENKNFVIDQTPVWLCVGTSVGCWRLQQVRGGVDPAYASPSDWVTFDRPASALKRTESDANTGQIENKSPKKKKPKHRLSLQT